MKENERGEEGEFQRRGKRKSKKFEKDGKRKAMEKK